MPWIVRLVTVVVALLVAAWTGVAAGRDRPPDRGQLTGILVVEAASLVLVGTALAHLTRAHATATFIGYVVAFLAVPVAGWALARMEPTRWGSVIIAAAAVVQAILVVRLQQVWVGI